MTRKRKRSEPMMPPPVKSDEGEMRSIFARTALSNVSLMEGVKTPREAAIRALRIADEMMRALKANHTPPPMVAEVSSEDMKRWEESIADAKTRENASQRDTVPARPRRRVTSIPPPMTKDVSRRDRKTPPLRIIGNGNSNRPTGAGLYKQIHLYDKK